jgi:hypothetical protein
MKYAKIVTEHHSGGLGAPEYTEEKFEPFKNEEAMMEFLKSEATVGRQPRIIKYEEFEYDVKIEVVIK